MENEQTEASEIPTTTAIPVEKRPRKKKGKLDEMLKSIHRIADLLSDTDLYTKLANGILYELKGLIGISNTFLPRLLSLEKLVEIAENLYGCSSNTNGFVFATHTELIKLNAALIELNQTVKSLRMAQMESPQMESNGRPAWSPPLPIVMAPPPSPSRDYPGGPPSASSYYAAQPAPPGGPPTGWQGPPPQGPPPQSPPQQQVESITSMLVDITDQQKYKLARDLNLFAIYDEDDFLRTDGLRQAQWIAERLPNPALAVPGIKAKVEEYRRYRNGGYKNKKN